MCTCVYKSNQKCVSIGGLYFGPLLVACLAQKWTHTLGQPFTYHAYLTGTEESKQIQRLHTLLGDFFPARCNHHLHLRNRTIFWRARPFFPVTHCPNNLIPIRSLQQHTQTQTHIQGQRESIFVTKGPLPCPPCSYYCLCNQTATTTTTLNGNLRVAISQATTPNAYMSAEKGSPCQRNEGKYGVQEGLSRKSKAQGGSKRTNTTYVQPLHTVEFLKLKVSGADQGADP